MDRLTHEFHSFLVAMHMKPELVNDKISHFMHHLMSLLTNDESEMLTRYYGILGSEQQGLKDIAREKHMSEDAALEKINNSLRRIAITPEWQSLRNMTLSRAYSNKTAYRHECDEHNRKDN